MRVLPEPRTLSRIILVADVLVTTLLLLIGVGIAATESPFIGLPVAAVALIVLIGLLRRSFVAFQITSIWLGLIAFGSILLAWLPSAPEFDSKVSMSLAIPFAVLFAFLAGASVWLARRLFVDSKSGN
jgi:hypothetical protein